ncbi:MAG: mannose-1-phosphate guanylyltransferase/mannose-6-phosphate isomerase [Fibrobacterales bacterium]
MINIIICGGAGTRLWPISRTLLPKQFVRLFSGRSLFMETVARNQEVCNSEFIVSNQAQQFLAEDQLRELKVTNNKYLLEPVGRNTAPAIALPCLTLDPDDIVLVTPSDQLITKQDDYLKAVQDAKKLAEEGHLVTFGIKPTFPETGFGYIEANGNDVVKFREKPSKKKAEEYISKGNFYWNSGMFCFKAGVFLEELKKYNPEILDACKKALKETTGEKILIDTDDMLNIPKDSIDYAVMEKSSIVKVVPADIGWSDLGSFDALYDELPKDDSGNTVAENLINVDSKNNLVLTNGRKVALVGVEDMIIVDTPDALLITPKGSSQKVKDVVNQLEKEGSDLHHNNITTYRPWGSYTILQDYKGYKVKRIVVKSGKRISLQKHMHRSEHWVVVSGTATVTVDKKEMIVRPNESTYIPIGTEHRLENQGIVDLVIIEAQVGEYTGEDDIIRIEDDYNRV